MTHNSIARTLTMLTWNTCDIQTTELNHCTITTKHGDPFARLWSYIKIVSNKYEGSSTNKKKAWPHDVTTGRHVSPSLRRTCRKRLFSKSAELIMAKMTARTMMGSTTATA